MSATRYGPEDTWPSHDKKHWREPLEQARQAGWTLTYIDAPHLFGPVMCPGGEHRFDVDKTARGSETKAKEALKKIRSCGHPPPGPIQLRRDRSQQLLDIAEQIAQEVEQGLGGVQSQVDAFRALDRLEARLEAAAANLDEVLQGELDQALEAAIEADDAAPDPLDLEGRLDTATESVAEGESAAKSLRPDHPGVAKPLLERACKLSERITRLRGRLAAVQEQPPPVSG